MLKHRRKKQERIVGRFLKKEDRSGSPYAIACLQWGTGTERSLPPSSGSAYSAEARNLQSAFSRLPCSAVLEAERTPQIDGDT